MSGSVIRRSSTTVTSDGYIIHDDTPATFAELERLVGRKLDRRKSYAIIQGEPCELVTWTDDCSGCNGGKCDECGHTGKRVNRQFVPIHDSDI